MPTIPVIMLLFAASLGLVYTSIQAFTIKGENPIINIPETAGQNSNFDAGTWMKEAPLDDINDFIFGGLVNTVEWISRGLSGGVESVVNWIIGHLNPLFKTALPNIKIPAIFVKAVFIALLGLFLITQIKGLADKAYSGITLFTAIILAAMAALVILIVFASVFIK